jgi:myo-inositol-1(or 4)-monophosphatase
MELEHIIAAVETTGRYLRANAFEDKHLELKGKNDYVTPYDRKAELILREELMKTAPGNFLGEEHGAQDNGSKRRYIIDSIDGTKDWIARDLRCATSVGIEENGELVGGIINDFMRGIMYVGYKGKCAIRIDGKEYPFREASGLSKHRIAIKRANQLKAKLPQEEFSFSDKAGSIALSMAELAAGNYDGMVYNNREKGNIWDVAAGYYLLKTAGFAMFDSKGNPYDYTNPRDGMIAVKPSLADRVLPIIAETLGIEYKVE